MAVTSIWPIKGRVDKVINYARNPEKTHDKESLSELHEIEGVVEYAADEMKTEKRAYDVLALCELRRNGHKSVEISRHYSIQHKDSSKTKRVTFAKRR